jgi:NAD-dependent SIR2 family protein deacetylase
LTNATPSELADALRKSRNAALVVGAGISYDMKIPLGYKIPMLYGEDHPHLLKKHGIDAIWQQAKDASAGDDRWRLEEHFVQVLVAAIVHSSELQRAFVDWLSRFGTMSGASSDIHAAFVLAWLKRVFNHLVTTNWDFLLEYHAEGIYEEAYLMPFEPVEFAFNGGQTANIAAERLSFLNPLDGDDYFWHPRWDIVANHSDLKNLQRWTRPIWKIHGSPFFLACPQCGGFSRWKRMEKLTVGDPCPQHPEEALKPEIIFWGQGIDKADPLVWKRLKGRLQRSDMIVACGFSGAGSDVYIRSVVESHPNAWVVNPDEKYWDVKRVSYVPAYASDLAGLLIEEFLV